MFLATHSCTQDFFFKPSTSTCSQFNPVHSSLWSPQEGCALHIIFLFVVRMFISIMLRDLLPISSLGVPLNPEATHPTMPHTPLHPHPDVLRFLTNRTHKCRPLCRRNSNGTKNLLKKTNKNNIVKNISLRTTDNFRVWLVESTRCSGLSVLLSVPPHAPTADHL